jgi:hypothetical protein
MKPIEKENFKDKVNRTIEAEYGGIPSPQEITTQKIEVVNWGEGYKAQIKADTRHWAYGKTIDEALGNLIRSWPENFNIYVSYPRV